MLNYPKIIFMAIFAVGYLFLSQMAFATDPFDTEKCEREAISSKAGSDHFSWERTYEKLRKEENRFCLGDLESSYGEWPQFFVDTNVVYHWAYGYQRRPAVVWGGGNYLVVWAEYLSNYHLIIDYNVYCSRVTPNGEILDTIAVPISIAPGDQLFASVVYNDVDYFVVWSDGRSGNLDIYGTRVSQDGTVLDPEGILIWTTPNDEFRPSVAWDGANYLVVWHAIQPGVSTTSIYGARISPEGDLLDDYPIFVSNDTLMQNYNPAIAWDGTNYLVVWEDSGGCYDSISIRGVRISPQGSVLDPDPIVITRLARFTSYPSVAWSGTNYLVVWKYFLETYYPNDIYGTRVAPDGQVLDSSGIPIGSVEGAAEEFPSVSWDGTNFFVTWRRTPNTSTLGARVTTEGDVLDLDGIDLGGGEGYNQKRPVSASDGITTLAVWEYQLDADNWNICGIRVDSGGTILDSSFMVSIGSNSQTNGTVGWDGENFLAVWQDLRAGQYSDLYGARISPSGQTIDSASFPICTVPQREVSPQLSWNGESFLAVWQDWRDGGWNIYSTLVSPDGVASDTAGRKMASSHGDDECPALDWSGESHMLVWRGQAGAAEPDLLGRRVSASGDPIGYSFEITTERGYYGAPQIAWGESNYLVVYPWMWFVGSYDIYGRIISVDGTLTGDEITICQDDFTQTDSYVTWGAGKYLVVWKDDRNGDYDIYGARLSSQGDVLDPEGIPIFVGAGIQEPRGLTYDGADYVVLWLDEGEDEFDNLNATRCTRVSPEGLVLDPLGVGIFSNTLSLSRLHFSPGDSNLSLIVGSKVVKDPPFSSPRLCGAFFWGDSIPNYPPEPFSLLSPADGDTVVRPACLDWEEAPDPNPEDDVHYDLYVSTSSYFDPDSTITIERISTSEYVLDDLEYSILYHWKVRAYDQWSSTWSDGIWSFDVENYGDASGDGIVDVADVIYLVNYLFGDGSAPDPLASGDENGDCLVDVADIVYLVNYLFLGGSPPQQGCA